MCSRGLTMATSDEERGALLAMIGRKIPRLEIKLSWFNWDHLAIDVYRHVAPDLLKVTYREKQK